MALVVFGEKVDMLNIPSPEPGGFLIGYDLDGILKQKDENGIISIVGGGNNPLSDVLSLGNNTGMNSIVLDSSIISGTNRISLDNSLVSLTTDNGLYGESYLFMNSESLLLSNGSKGFRVEKDIYDNYNVITRYDVNNEQVIKENSYKLNLNDKPVLEFTIGTTSTIGGSRLSSLLSSDGSIINTGVINTVVLGGFGINALQSNSAYVPDLYIQDGKLIKGTNGSAKIQFTQYNDIISSNDNSFFGILSSTSSTVLNSNGILVRDTLNSTSTPNIDAGISYISTKNSNTSSGVANSVVLGGEGLSVTESNTVYLGNTVNINNKYKLPNVDGLTGQVLKTDGSGNTSWDYTILTLNTIILTTSEFQSLNGFFDTETTYMITNADINLYDGTEIYLTTNSNGILNDTGIGKFYNPLYDQLTSGFGIWNISNSYSIGDVSIWGGYYWNNTTGLVGTTIDIYTLSSDWTKETYLPYYEISYDIIKYDWINDLITYRNEKNTNIVSTNKADIFYWSTIDTLYNPIKSFQWGNIYDFVTDKGIGSQNIDNSYNQNINFTGSKQTNIKFNNKSYQINSIFESDSYQNNIIFNNSHQDSVNFSNSSYQEGLNFLNSNQTLLTESTGLSQVNLVFENNESNRSSTPLTLSESGLFIGGDVTIDGKLTVFGTASIINSENLLVQDPIILLSGTQSGTPTLDSGIFINRGTSITEAFIWDESMSEFSFISTNDDSMVIGDVNIVDYSNIHANDAIMTGTVSSTAFKLFSGTGLQFLKGDGTVDTNTYTPTGRTITINGASYDLSTNRTWNVGTLTGVGATGYIPKYLGSTVLGNSSIYDNGSTITIGANQTVDGHLLIGTTISNGIDKLQVAGSGILYGISLSPTDFYNGTYLTFNSAYGNSYIKSDGVGTYAGLMIKYGLNNNVKFQSNGSTIFGSQSDNGIDALVQVAGLISTTSINLTSLPITSTGGYDILTRNTSTGQVEKVASAGIGDMTLGTAQTFTGTKTFSVTSLSTPALSITNALAGGGTSHGIYLSNTNDGTGIYINQTGTGSGINAAVSGGNGFNAVVSVAGAVGYRVLASNATQGIYATNNGTSAGIFSLNNSTGSGMYSQNGSTGNGIVSTNGSTGQGIYSQNSSSGIGMRLENSTAATGKPFQYTKNSVEKAFINDAGDLSAQSVTVLGTLGLSNVANTFTSLFTNTNTAARTYILPDKDITIAGLVDIPWTTTGNNIANSNSGSIYLGGVTAAQANYARFGIKAFATTENIFSWVLNNGTLAGYIDFQGRIYANSGLTVSSITNNSNIVFPNINTGLSGNNNGTTTFNTKNTYWESNTKIDYATDISGSYTTRSLVDKGYTETSAQTISGIKTYLSGTLGLRNVANTFTSLFTNTNTAARTYTLQDRNGTLLDSTDLSTINTSLGTKQSVFTGTTDYLPKSINSTTLGVSRIIDNGTYIGIGTANTPTKDFTLGNQANREIGIEESSNTIVGRDLVVTAGRTINYVPNTNFNPLSQTSRNWWGITSASNGNVYSTSENGDIYMQTNGTGNFVALGQTSRNWRGITSASNGNVYATVTGGDIYMQTNGTGNFVALGQTSRTWWGITSASNGNVYATVTGGDIYMQTNGTGNFVALGQTSRLWYGITSASNGNVYAVVYGGDIYMQTNGTGNFVALGQTSRNWVGITSASNGNVYSTSENGDIYMQTNGTGNFVALGQTSRLWYGITSASNGNVYAVVYGGDIYMQQNNGTGTSDLQGGTLKLKAGTGKGTGQSKIQFLTGAKTASGTDMQVETVRAEIDEQGVFKLNSIPTYADNTTALAGGLTAGMFYRTAVGILMIVY